ncbi:MAG: hypothetical protein HQ566_05590, partial [Candidatus Omnitrophica bacterium]|nr:hypothetical protein [Candidatus Omnitrophota bacterium]
MLDWQGKKWVKVIAVTVVFAFLTYDIAWAMDFSPLVTTRATAPGAPELQPKIDSSISKILPKKIQEDKDSEETEISFRSQLVPRKKYGERSGFLRMQSVKDIIKRQMNEMQRRQQIQEDRHRRDFINYNINKGLYMDQVEKGQEAQSLQQQIMKARGLTFDAAAKMGEFSYVINKDGSRVNYKDGLPSSIYNEPVHDNLGQLLGYKNTFNMSYDSKRFLGSYDSEIIDPLGNITKILWRNGKYSSDSVWWAGSDTNAGKYLLGYTEIITDPYGATTVREWSTTRNGYDGKKLSIYDEVLKDATGSVISSSSWSNPTYEGDTLTGYHQETTDAYGNVTISNWSAEFEGERMLSSHSVDNQINRDGTSSVNDNTLTYEYGEDNKIIRAYGISNVTGETKDVNGYTVYTHTGTNEQFYELVNGQLKIVYTLSDTEQVNADSSTSSTHTRFDYVYDPETNLMIDAAETSTTEGEDIFGSSYMSKTVSEYDTIAGQPRRVSSDTETVSDTIFGGALITNSHVEYMYDELGNFRGDGAKGYTNTTGINIFGENSSTHTVNEYEIINGQPKLKYSQTGPDLV